MKKCDIFIPPQKLVSHDPPQPSICPALFSLDPSLQTASGSSSSRRTTASASSLFAGLHASRVKWSVVVARAFGWDERLFSGSRRSPHRIVEAIRIVATNINEPRPNSSDDKTSRHHYHG